MVPGQLYVHMREKKKKKKQQTLFRILHHKEISNAGDYRPKCEKLKKKTF